MSIRWLAPTDPPEAFPNVEQALTEPDGLLAAGGDLAPARILEAYRRGIFPWYEEGQPILWWSPDPRTVLLPKDIHVSRRLARTISQQPFDLSADRAFRDVVTGCSQPRNYTDGTWITSAMADAYQALHHQGWAHSVEAWQDGELVGGIYGVALGRVFFGESMFSRRRDASKVVLVATARFVDALGFELIDCQVHSQHLQTMGATRVSRHDFVNRLADLIDQGPGPGNWDKDFSASLPLK